MQSDWLEIEELQGDVIVTANVTYFVRDIVGFVSKLEQATRRRVVMNVWSVPPPNRNRSLFRLVYGEDLEEAPGHQQLLPVLWEMGILPEVYLLPGDFRAGEFPQSREEAIREIMRGRWIGPKDQEQARRVIEKHFQEIYEEGPEGFIPLWRPVVRELMITWEKRGDELNR